MVCGSSRWNPVAVNVDHQRRLPRIIQALPHTHRKKRGILLHQSVRATCCFTARAGAHRGGGQGRDPRSQRALRRRTKSHCMRRGGNHLGPHATYRGRHVGRHALINIHKDRALAGGVVALAHGHAQDPRRRIDQCAACRHGLLHARNLGIGQRTALRRETVCCRHSSGN